jgi:signal transduction histidine kinase
VINTVRHSGASRVAVALGFAPRGLELRVRDDGRGFDPEAHAREARGQHFGVVGMVERAESLGGRLQIQSGPGRGTEVFCFLPYDGTAEPPGTAAKGVPS